VDFIWLIFAHFIGDFPLQGEFLAVSKGRFWYLMLSHAIIWTACICVALQYLGILYLWKIPFLVIGHMAIDFWKCRKPATEWKYIYPDQGFHFLQCLIVYVVNP
jgi:hypothetical protein